MKTKKKSQPSSSNCRPTFRISKAGHLLSTKGGSGAGRILSRDGKQEKQKRLKRGCLSGSDTTFRLTAKQKRNLPIALQRAIVEHHRKLGKTIID